MPDRQPCAFVAACGRPIGHRGHHGGWRTHLARLGSVVRHSDRGRLGEELSPRQLQLVAEYAVHGSYKDAAACVGIAEQTMKNHVTAALTKTGAVSVGHVPFVLGWVSFPRGLIPEDHADLSVDEADEIAKWTRSA